MNSPRGKTRPRVLLAEDDRAYRTGLAALFESAGYEVEAAADGAAALEAFRRRRADLLVLDVMMPVMNGLDACRAARLADPSVPVLFLTALDGEKDEIACLESGGDSHLPKTASGELLLARAAALLRRTRGDGLFAIGRTTVDGPALAARSPDGALAALTEREVALLRFFAEHPGEVFNREFLAERFVGSAPEGADAALSMAVSRLRAKLGGDGRTIETVHRVGYRYSPENAE